MGRLWQGLAWAGIIWCAFLAFWLRSGFGWAACAVGAALCIAYLVSTARHARRLDRALPAALDRLAFCSTETYVAFAWRWHGRRGGRLRILRSEEHGARDPDDTRGGQVVVFDGEGDTFVDNAVQARRQYTYTIFAQQGRAGWAEPVRQVVLTYAKEERESIEESEKGRYTGPAWTDPAFTRRGENPFIDAAAGVATDLIFAAASVFAGDKAADGWQEIT